jgi:hypothetical protein
VEGVPGFDPVSEDRDDYGLEQAAPRRKAEASNRVSQKGHGPDGGPASGSECFNVRFPGQLGVEE